jgi:hypothetical protein
LPGLDGGVFTFPGLDFSTQVREIPAGAHCRYGFIEALARAFEGNQCRHGRFILKAACHFKDDFLPDFRRQGWRFLRES